MNFTTLTLIDNEKRILTTKKWVEVKKPKYNPFFFSFQRKLLDTIDAVVVNEVFENIFTLRTLNHKLQFSACVIYATELISNNYISRGMIFVNLWLFNWCLLRVYRLCIFSFNSIYTFDFGISLPFVVKDAKWKPAAVYVLLFYFEFLLSLSSQSCPEARNSCLGF